ncbi:MAG: cysteine synthase A [Firmicutes bacterium]|nr:cysteine synthase A [Bacillota bacterium]
MTVYENITELIGGTPVMRLGNYAAAEGLAANILAKLENMNPAGSAKDRVAAEMIARAEAAGELLPGATIIEPTSGNTGIGLASVGTAKGYKVVLTMPDTMSIERRNLVQAFGAQVVLTEGARGMQGAIDKAEELCRQTPGAVILGQFVNPANPAAHYKTTGPEIWRDTDGQIDVLVATVGTGGTLSGSGRYLKEQNPDIRVIAVEPQASAVLSGGQAGLHKIQGIGAGFVPDTLDTTVYDEVIAVPDEAAMQTANRIAKTEGLLVGISSGAAVWAAARVAAREEMHGRNIVVILPDTGERYLSTGIYSED